MPRRSQAWKALERLTAKELGGERVTRGDDFSKKEVDVKVPDFESLQIDAKYRKRLWHHHKFLSDVRAKYCPNDADLAILVTKNPRQRGAVVSMELAHFGCLLDAIRELRQENERLRERSDADL